MMDSRTRERSDTESTPETEQSQEQTCPECGEKVLRTNDTGERVCTACGLVLDEQRIDRGPEWRAFDAAEKDEKSRVGAPTTQLKHDKGLSTNIGWRDKDAYGNSLSSRKRQKLQRLRTWNERFRTRDSAERNLKQALGEIERMSSALGIHQQAREFASVMYRRALDDGLLPGRSIEGVATAVLYAATRLDGTPRTIDELADVSRVEPLEIKRTYRYVVRELGVQVPPSDPMEYVGRIVSDVGCSDETGRHAREMIEAATSRGVHSGKHPVGIAASAVYAAGKLCGEDITQGDVSEVADVSNVTIRNRYREVLDAFEAANGDRDV
jgi:transcription initiation factor TFIIB